MMSGLSLSLSSMFTCPLQRCRLVLVQMSLHHSQQRQGPLAVDSKLLQPSQSALLMGSHQQSCSKLHVVLRLGAHLGVFSQVILELVTNFTCHVVCHVGSHVVRVSVPAVLLGELNNTVAACDNIM